MSTGASMVLAYEYGNRNDYRNWDLSASTSTGMGTTALRLSNNQPNVDYLSDDPSNTAISPYN